MIECRKGFMQSSHKIGKKVSVSSVKELLALKKRNKLLLDHESSDFSHFLLYPTDLTSKQKQV